MKDEPTNIDQRRNQLQAMDKREVNTGDTTINNNHMRYQPNNIRNLGNKIRTNVTSK